MGIQLSKLVKGSEIEIEYLRGRTIAVDAFLWMHQFLSIIRGYDGTPLKTSKGKISSHISGICYRSAKLIEAGVNLVWVFDGPKPEFKYVVSERRTVREEAEKRWKKALAAGKMDEARSAAQQTATVNKEMIEDSKKLLEYMGIPFVQAPSEGEAQCAHMCKSKVVYGSASQDFDSLMFGSSLLIRNLSITGKRKVPRKKYYVEVKPELIELERVLKELGINQDQLILVGMLIGSDFNPGIHGIGPKKALKIVKEEKTLDK
ncbi:MAG: flap endonuclease-1, partial [Candidatus Aenigmarchaeota archaeon]|nr:flap endonuclease-1 [Candidatus Aenigmarchaeota archaeon]